MKPRGKWLVPICVLVGALLIAFSLFSPTAVSGGRVFDFVLGSLLVIFALTQRADAPK